MKIFACLLLLALSVDAAPSRQHELSLQLLGSVKARDTVSVKRLLARGANPNARDDSGRKLWRKKGREGWVEVWNTQKRARIKRPLSFTMKPFAGPTALMIAARQDDLPVARALLDAGANRDLSGVDFEASRWDSFSSDLETRWTPLSQAMMAASPRMMRLLLDSGADIHTPNSNGTTHLQLLQNMRPSGPETPAQARKSGAMLAVLRAYNVRKPVVARRQKVR